MTATPTLRLMEWLKLNRNHPPFVKRQRRFVWWMLSIPVAYAASGVVMDMIGVRGGVHGMLAWNPWTWLVLGLTPMLGPILATWIIIRIRFRRARVAWVRSNGRLCVHCAHDLTGLGERGLCPECGQPFVVHDDRKRWQAAGMEPVRE